MIIYRPHRGGLDESMAEAKEFQTEEEMKRYIYEHHKSYFLDLGYTDAPFEIEDIVIDYENSHEDKRIGWKDTMHVCVKRYGNEVYDYPQCIGMCATDYDKKN